MDNKRTFKISVILLAILYLAVGLGDLIGGASTDSRFYNFDNLLIKIIGVILIISSIGLLFKKEIARKGIIIALSLSLIEIFIGIPKNIYFVEFILGVMSMLIVYVPGIVYFIILKNKGYFI